MSSTEDKGLLTTSHSANSSERQLEELANTRGGTAARPNSKPGMKTNMVARDVRVKATGACPGKSDDEPFTEETNSVLVHENGGWIHMSTAVAPGQLLLLSNVETKREVVGQVIRKRSYKPMGWYVELKFAESAPRFWGMEFSAAAALLPKDTKDAEAAALVISAQASANEPEELPPAPSVEEVQAFKRKTEGRGERAVGGAAREALPDEQLTAADQALVPKPLLDFSMSLPKGRSRRARGKFTPEFRGGVLRLAVLTAMLLVTVAGAARYRHWIPWNSGTRAPSPSISVPRKAGSARASLPTVSREAAKEHLELTTNVGSDTPVTSPSLPSLVTQAPGQPFASSGTTVRPAARRAASSAGLEGKRAPIRPTTAGNFEPMVASAAENAILPPKLIKAVRAVASLDDLRDFETGNVVIDAVVGPDGEVHFISVISGPPSLQGPAVKAVKQYQYEPATRNGQPVAAHVHITIRFRFES